MVTDLRGGYVAAINPKAVRHRLYDGTMRRGVAYLFYILGLMLGLAAFTGNGGGFMGTLYGIVGAVAAWWIACGFGVRLGVTPDEFAASVKHLLGFGVHYGSSKEPSPEPPPEA